MIVIGLMSGTSGDGIDASIVEFFGIPPQVEWRLICHQHYPFTKELRSEIFQCFSPECSGVDRLCRLNFSLSEAYSKAVLDTIRAAGMTPDQVDLIGNHGQTLWHIPAGQPDASTLQLGDPCVIAERTGIPVVSNFRTADMAAGGNGAPLVSFADVTLFGSPDKVRAAQNIGGIGNVTYIPRQNDGAHQPLAFDTGPGNMLIDFAAEQISGGQFTYDKDAEMGLKGKVDEAFLNEMMKDPYFAQKPPKSTGREYFGVQYGHVLWEKAQKIGMADNDFVATMTAFTARSIADAYRDFLPEFPQEVVVSGGGTLNPLLMQLLAQELAPAKVFPIDELGLPSEAKEAAAFALMAYETWYKRPGNVPSATGASRPVIMGSLTWAPPKDLSAATTTESQNQKTMRIDEMSTFGLLQTINDEDQKVAEAVGRELPAIVKAVDGISERVARGGRLIYIGAGTSGRLGVLDASEMPPTFGVTSELVIGKIAGGPSALTVSSEGAEDHPEDGAEEIRKLDVTELDSVVGIAASGNTPYVLGALDEAKRRNALTIGIACNKNGKINAHVDIAILPVPGPEIVSGSTRMKSGTAQKMVLNMLSTAVMIKQGKTYGNLMVDVSASNDKLVARKRRITALACKVSEAEADELLERCDGSVKKAIVVHDKGVSPQEAEARLERSHGFVKKALED